MMTHNCVSSTVRAAWDYGFEITLIEDATATRFLETPSGIKIDATLVQNAHIASLTRFSEVTTTDDFIQEN